MSGNDLTIYEEYAHEWWEPGSFHFASLQNITPFRILLIKEFVGSLKGKKVLDLGCGGGLLSKPLIDEGAILTGVDISEGSINAARNATNGIGDFFCQDIRKFNTETKYDLILLADVIDHISDYEKIIKNASASLKPGGLLFISTINRTFLSKVLAIKVGEGLKLIPPGTHDWDMFVRPSELRAKAENVNLTEIAAIGEWPKIIKSIFSGSITLRKSRSLLLGYALIFKK